MNAFEMYCSCGSTAYPDFDGTPLCGLCDNVSEECECLGNVKETGNLRENKLI